MLGGLIDKLFGRQREDDFMKLGEMLEEDDRRRAASMGNKSLHEQIDDDGVMDDYYENNEEIDEAKYDLIRAKLAYPEVLPCRFDNTVEFWLMRIEMWGKLKVWYVDPQGRKKVSGRDEILKACYDDHLLRTLGKWGFRKKGFAEFEMVRQFNDFSGKKREEKFIVKIDLKPEIKNAMNGKF